MEKLDKETLKELGDILGNRLEADVKKLVGEALDEKTLELEAKLSKSFDEKLSAKTEIDNTAKATKTTEDIAAGDGDKSLEGVALMAKFLRGVAKNNPELVKEAQSASTKAMGELTGANGGFLVPEELEANIWRIQGLQGLARAQATIKQMNREMLHLNRLNGNVTAYWAGHTVSMTESSPTIQRITLYAEALTGLTQFENELLDDEDANLVNEVTNLFAEAFGTEEDNQMFNGDGDPFVGIFNDADVTVITMTTADNTFEELIPTDLRKLLYSISSKALPGAAFYMSPYAWHIIQTLTQNSQFMTTFSNPVFSKNAWTPDQITDAAGSIWGYPVFLSDQLPGAADTGASVKWIVFGNLKYFVVGDRKGMEVDMSKDATIGSTNLFQTNQSALRLVRRVAMGVGIPGAFAVLKTAAAT